MSPRMSAITQNDAKKLFKAAIAAGFGSASITFHPDGRVEAAASLEASHEASSPTLNTMDALLKKKVR